MSPPKWEELEPAQPDGIVPAWESLEPVGAPPEPPSALETAAPTLASRFASSSTFTDLFRGAGLTPEEESQAYGKAEALARAKLQAYKEAATDPIMWLSTVGGIGAGAGAARLGLRALPQALARILGTVAGAEAGGQVEGKPTGEAAKGMAPWAVGIESLMALPASVRWLIRRAARSAPGAGAVLRDVAAKEATGIPAMVEEAATTSVPAGSVQDRLLYLRAARERRLGAARERFAERAGAAEGTTAESGAQIGETGRDILKSNKFFQDYLYDEMRALPTGKPEVNMAAAARRAAEAQLDTELANAALARGETSARLRPLAGEYVPGAKKPTVPKLTEEGRIFDPEAPLPSGEPPAGAAFVTTGQVADPAENMIRTIANYGEDTLLSPQQVTALMKRVGRMSESDSRLKRVYRGLQESMEAWAAEGTGGPYREVYNRAREFTKESILPLQEGPLASLIAEGKEPVGRVRALFRKGDASINLLRDWHKQTRGAGPGWEAVRGEAVKQSLASQKFFDTLGPETRKLVFQEGEEAFLTKLHRMLAEPVEREALRATRPKVASEALAKIIRPTLLEGRETMNIAAGKAIRALQDAVTKDPFLRESFPPGTLERVYERLEAIRRLPVAGAPPGADAGSKRMARAGMTGGAAALIVDYAFGGSLPRPIVAAIGTLTSIGSAEIIAKLLTTTKGTKGLLWATGPSRWAVPESIKRASPGLAAYLGQRSGERFP